MFFNADDVLEMFKKGSILCNLKQMADEATTTPNISNYAHKIVRDVIATNCYIMNGMFIYLSYLPEWLMLLLYGSLWYLFVMIMGIMNIGITYWYCITHLINTFGRKGSGEVIEDPPSSGYLSYFSSILVKCFMFFIIFIILLLIIHLFLGAIFFTIYSLCLPLFVKYADKKDGVSYNRKNGFMQFFTDVLYFRKTLLMIVSLLGLFYSFVSAGGANATLPAVIIIGIVYALGYLNDKKIQEEILANMSGDFVNIARDYIITQAEVSKEPSGNPYECYHRRSGTNKS
jgi:hypothetical protein